MTAHDHPARVPGCFRCDLSAQEVAGAGAPHLWEPEHDFYGPEAPWWGRPADYLPYIQRFDSWADFANGDSMHSAPNGLNLLYRWDWHAWHIEFPEDYPDGKTRWEFEAFWMMPRKGIMARSVVTVTPEDEPAVRAWLAPHWEYMRALWAPLATGEGDGPAPACTCGMNEPNIDCPKHGECASHGHPCHCGARDEGGFHG